MVPQEVPDPSINSPCDAMVRKLVEKQAVVYLVEGFGQIHQLLACFEVQNKFVCKVK